MVFYLDPGAGTQRIVNIFGRVREAERLERGFHYSSLPTTDYRNRFGHAAFAAAAGTSVSLLSIGGSRQVPSDDLPVIFDPDRAELVGLPSEVLESRNRLRERGNPSALRLAPLLAFVAGGIRRSHAL